MIYCAVKDSTSLVINRIVWDGETPYTYPEEGVTLVASELGQITDKYEDGKFYWWNEGESGEEPHWEERV